MRASVPAASFAITLSGQRSFLPMRGRIATSEAGVIISYARIVDSNVCMKYKICTLSARGDNVISGGEDGRLHRADGGRAAGVADRAHRHARARERLRQGQQGQGHAGGLRERLPHIRVLVPRPGIAALPASAESLCAFLADQASLGKRASTLGRRLAAIRYFHRAAGYDTPTGDEKVKAVLSGIRRTIGAAPTPPSSASTRRPSAATACAPAS
jgi:hypothetical protein